MDATKMTGKQFLIQLGINILASAIVSYIMYKVLQPKDPSTTPTGLPSQVSTTPPVTATTTPPVL